IRDLEHKIYSSEDDLGVDVMVENMRKVEWLESRQLELYEKKKRLAQERDKARDDLNAALQAAFQHLERGLVEKYGDTKIKQLKQERDLERRLSMAQAFTEVDWSACQDAEQWKLVSTGTSSQHCDHLLYVIGTTIESLSFRCAIHFSADH